MPCDDEGAVQVAVRERPIFQKTLENAQSVVTYSSHKNIIVVNERPYEYDHCFGPDTTQKELYDELVKPLVRRTLQGYFCSALAYGQTGTGKTFTMGLHNQYTSGDAVGMIPRALRDIFELISDKSDEHQISVSFVEIYNEKVYDLLAEDTNEQINVKGCKFGGGIKMPITNALEGFTALTQGNKCRHIRPTKMNPESSRSHAIFTIHVSREMEFCHVNSLLNLVDLAGSEGVRRTGHHGVALTEGIHINQGLLSIGKVLQALACKRKVIPYRDSVLSSVLQDSLKPNSYLALLVCISPLQEDLSETLSTLRFAADAKSLKHTPQINSILMEIKKNKIKTPQKSFMLPLCPSNSQTKTPAPLKRAFSNGSFGPLSTIKKPIHSNTFCTPNKLKKMVVRPLNQTDIGLTPKEKMKFGKSNLKFDDIRLDLPLLKTPQIGNHDESIDSRYSILSMNASTSTAVEAPSVPCTTSYSPIVRRCLNEIGPMIVGQIEKIFENSIRQLGKTQITVSDSISNGEERQTVKSSLYATQPAYRIEHNNTELDLTKYQAEPFAQSSPIFKVPDQPKSKHLTEVQPLLNETAKFAMEKTREIIFFEASRIDDNTIANETVVPAVRRRSRRISKTTEMHLPTRRSMRIEQRNSTMIVPQEEKVNTLQSFRRSTLSGNLPKQRRESVRRSTRIEKRNTLMPIVASPEIEYLPLKKVCRKVPVNNKTIAEYFNSHSIPCKPKTKKEVKNTKQKHEQAVFDLLNTGNIREIQILPEIGLKTAYKIVTQRTLNGKFKNFEQISKLPIWRGKAWERFKVANSIS